MHTVGDLTWDTIQRRIQGGALAILPIGAGAKQHGWHLPMRTDQIQAEWLAARLADRFEALIWPTVTYGYYPAFVDYSGSSSLSSSVFSAMIGELVSALLAYGPHVVIVDTGISTIAPIDKAIARFSDRVLHLKIHDGPRYRAAAARVETQAHGGHADELETSRILALEPATVAMDRAGPSPLKPPGPGPMQHCDPGAANYSASGSIGDPRAATTAKGQEMLGCMMDDMIEALERWSILR